MDIQMNDRFARIAHPESAHAFLDHAQAGFLFHA